MSKLLVLRAMIAIALPLHFVTMVQVALADEQAAASRSSDKHDDSDPNAPKKKGYIEQVKVEGRSDKLVGVAESATEGVVGQTDLSQRPILRPAELLEAIPGVVISQHSGSGKANQYYLRGFNLDHGTDFRTTVDGIPLNMPSHGHGQGYSDLNFLIPELVSAEQFRKGPYSARDGDFSAAGSVNIDLLTSLPQGIIEATPGAFDYRRLLWAQSMATPAGDLLGAVEYLHNDGPWEHPDDYRKYNGLVRFNHGDSANGFSLTAMGYNGEWSSTDQVPQRAVSNGSLDRFGAVDPSDGGQTHRFSFSGQFSHAGDTGLTRLTTYALHYDLKLFSNFTYFLDDPINGDQFEQQDRRFVSGVELTHEWTGQVSGREWDNAVGLQLRRDDIENGLFHTRERQRLSTTREDQILQYGAGPFVENRVRWTSRLRTIAGLRLDYYHASVDSSLSTNSGSADATLMSPKLSVILGPWKDTEYYFNFGYGFHSNDARGATITVDPTTGLPARSVDPLVRARGVDVGFRTQVIPNLQTTLSAFLLDLDSELIFTGDAGTTEPSRPSRRTGIEFANFYKAREWCTLDLDVSLSHGRFTDHDPAGDRIPGSIQSVVAAGVSFTDLHHIFGSLRLRYFGPRPLVEDDSVRSRSSTLINSSVGYDFGRTARLSLEVFNVLNKRVSDVDYFYTSRLQNEPTPVDDIHFHPAEPRSARLMLKLNL